MADNFSVSLTTALLASTATEYTQTTTSTGSHTEDFRITMTLAAGASDTSLALGGLTDPKFIAVMGGDGCSFKVAAGTDAIGCNPLAILMDEDDGLNMSSILLSNADSQNHTIIVVAAE